MRTIRDIIQRFPSAAEHGLTSDQVLESRRLYGSNRLTPIPREPGWRKLLAKFNEPIIKILLAAAFLSILVGTPLDGFAILIAVILATGVAFASEYKSDREFEALNAQKEAQRVKVIRGGDVQTIILDEVVVGDAVILEAGDEIPADGEVIKAADLHVDQSLMTGESEPAGKHPVTSAEPSAGLEEPGRLFRGTQVVEGLGQMLVTEVGDATLLGQIARQLSADTSAEPDDRASGDTTRRVKHKLTISKELTPLQEKLGKLASQISKVGYAAAVAIFLVLLIPGLRTGELDWSSVGPSQLAARLLSYFLYVVVVIVVAVPEGLPMSVALSLALAMRKMTRANCLVRQLTACETVGSTTVICTDKTGTLTQNRMQVVRSAWGGRVYDRGTPDWDLPPGYRAGENWAGTPLDWFILNAAVNSTAHLEEKDGKLLPVGSSTEGALLLLLHEAGMDYRKLRLQFEPLLQVHFTSERKRMTTVVRKDERLVALVKGSPEGILEQSTHYLANDGTVHEWTAAARAAVDAHLRDTARQAMRALAFGYAELPAGMPGDRDTLHALCEVDLQNLVYGGFVALRDPLRGDAKEAIDVCRQAGIEVKVITGDNLETARSIGLEIGLLDRPDAEILSSQEFNAQSDEQLKERLPNLHILARAQPLDKLRLVKLLQEQKEVVAVTGDGTNDAPALKRADVGLAMGRTGTEVAREASKIVLLDDAFATIVKAVHWGRALYENIQRFVQFQLTINISALVIVFLAPILGVRPPFTILQLLWINVIMDTLAALALCSEPPRPGLMHLPPKRRDENIVTPPMLRNILTTAAFFVIMMMTLLLGMYRRKWFAGAGAESTEFPGLTVRQGTIFFTVYIFFQIWNEINCRSLVPAVSGLDGLFRNRTFLAIAGTVMLLHVLIVSFGGRIFHVEPLSLTDWLAIAGCTASVLVFAEVARRITRLLHRNAAAKE